MCSTAMLFVHCVYIQKKNQCSFRRKQRLATPISSPPPRIKKKSLNYIPKSCFLNEMSHSVHTLPSEFPKIG